MGEPGDNVLPGDVWIRLLRSQDPDVRQATKAITDLDCRLTKAEKFAKDWNINDAARTRQKDLEDQADLANDNARQLRCEVESLQRYNSRLDSRVQEMEESGANAHRRNADDAVEIQRLRSELLRCQKECAEFKSRCGAAEQARDRVVAELAISHAATKHSSHLANAAEAKVTSLKLRLSEVSAELAACQERVVCSTSQRHIVCQNERAHTSQLQHQLDSTRAAVADAHVTIASLEHQLCKAHQRAEELDAQLKLSRQPPEPAVVALKNENNDSSPAELPMHVQPERGSKRAREPYNDDDCTRQKVNCGSLEQLKLEHEIDRLQQTHDAFQRCEDDLREDLADANHEIHTLKCMTADLGRQVRLLLYEGLRAEHDGVQQLVRKGNVLVPAFGPPGSDAVPAAVLDSSADDVISKYLVTFHDISELQVKNTELLKVCRTLAQDKERNDAEMEQRLQKAQAELAKLKESSEWQAKALKSVVLESSGDEQRTAASNLHQSHELLQTNQNLKEQLAQAEHRLSAVQELATTGNKELQLQRDEVLRLQECNHQMSAQIVAYQTHAVQDTAETSRAPIPAPVSVQPNATAQNSDMLHQQQQENLRLQQLINSIRRSSDTMTSADKEVVERLTNRVNILDAEKKVLSTKLNESKAAAEEITRLMKLKERQWQSQLDAISFSGNQALAVTSKPGGSQSVLVQKLQSSLAVANAEIKMLLERVAQNELAAISASEDPHHKASHRVLPQTKDAMEETDMYLVDVEAKLYKLIDEKAAMDKQLEDCQKKSKEAAAVAATENAALQEQLSQRQECYKEQQNLVQKLTQELDDQRKMTSDVKCDVTLYARLHREAVTNFEQEVELHAKDLTALSAALNK